MGKHQVFEQHDHSNFSDAFVDGCTDAFLFEDTATDSVGILIADFVLDGEEGVCFFGEQITTSESGSKTAGMPEFGVRKGVRKKSKESQVKKKRGKERGETSSIS